MKISARNTEKYAIMNYIREKFFTFIMLLMDPGIAKSHVKLKTTVNLSTLY
jgi:hypothetical protein